MTLYEIEFRVRTKDPHQFVVWQHAISVDRKVKCAFCRRRPSSFSLEHHTRWKWPPTGSKQLRSTRQTKNWFIKRLHQSPNIMEQNLQTKKSTKKKRAWNQNVIKAQKTKKKRKSKYNLVVQKLCYIWHLVFAPLQTAEKNTDFLWQWFCFSIFLNWFPSPNCGVMITCQRRHFWSIMIVSAVNDKKPSFHP